MEKKTKAIAYYRVSTQKQGISGLGLAAQKTAVKQLASGSRYEIIKEYKEIESGKNSKNRPKLLQAIEKCKKEKATLLIAKLDRLSRNAWFIMTLMESRVRFIAADNPHANDLIVRIMAAFAQHEREQISERTTAALAKYKGKGILGRNGATLAKANKAAALRAAKALQPQIEALRARGTNTVQTLAKALGKHPTQVQRIITRLKQANGN